MNEILIKSLIKHKLDMVDLIVNSLPEKVSEEVKGLGRIILESVNESFREKKEQPGGKSKGKLENVPIE